MIQPQKNNPDGGPDGYVIDMRIPVACEFFPPNKQKF